MRFGPHHLVLSVSRPDRFVLRRLTFLTVTAVYLEKEALFFRGPRTVLRLSRVTLGRQLPDQGLLLFTHGLVFSGRTTGERRGKQNTPRCTPSPDSAHAFPRF